MAQFVLKFITFSRNLDNHIQWHYQFLMKGINGGKNEHKMQAMDHFNINQLTKFSIYDNIWLKNNPISRIWYRLKKI